MKDELAHKPVLIVTLVVAVLLVCTMSLFPQSQPFTATLAIGKSAAVPDTNITATVDDVTEDSRCPTGTVCIWEGDAAVKVRFTAPNAAAATYTLHTSARFSKTADHENLKVMLVSVTPHPAADSRIRRDDYRVTLSIERK